MTAPDRLPPIDAADHTAVLPRLVSDGLPAEELEAAAEPSFEDEHKGAAGNSMLMAVGSLVSRGTGFLRTAVLTAAIGTEVLGDTYTTAQIFPGMIYELLLGGILSSVLVPMLVRARKTDPDRGEAYTQRLLTITMIVLGITTVLAVICAPLLSLTYASGNPQEYRDLITALSYLMLPTIFFYGVTGLCSAVLNTRGRFGPPMWTPILNNIVVIGTGIAFMVIYHDKPVTDPSQVTRGEILLLGGGVLLGILIQSIGLLPALRKVGFRWRLRFGFRELGLRRLARIGGWMLCYVIVNQLALLVMTNLLNRGQKHGPGPMIYNNVFLLMMMAHGIIAVSIITALLPRMSAAAADGRASDIAADLGRGIRMVSVVIAPIAVTYAVLALPIAIALFERGAVNREASIHTAPVLMVAGLALLPFAISQLFNFSYYAMQDTKTPALINLPVISLRLALQLGWIAAFAISTTAVGMMFGNAVSYIAAALFSAVLLKRRIGLIGLRRISTTLAKVLVAALIAAAAGWGSVKLLYMGATQSSVSSLTAWVTLIFGGLIICGVYGAVTLALRVEEVHDVLGMVRRRLGR
ncbi:murein biosynthesis integral membrane protein MurJ [Catellatospora tritici]|uniref:murein biosynthesis integral membrane protein MurJ n=1 Tax=Catellatospora tritici TaxID=2851566 RepID=UPI001C2D7918|nr:murein biosynthesis integral membrane protein MurJ [Catellatospora tritici]MBV1852211.1 murein biosynthesis integral membrane protein MurJ [Catellatospora tritici]